MYITNQNRVKIFNIRGIEIGNIPAKGTPVNVTGAQVTIQQRGACFPVSYNKLSGYVMTGMLDLKQPPAPPPPPPSGEWRLYYLPHDKFNPVYQAEAPSRVRQNIPAVYRIGEFTNYNNHTKVPLTYERQLLWADGLALRVYSETYGNLKPAQQDYIENRLEALTGPKLAFTNRPIDDKVAYYLSGKNITSDPPMFAPLICAGNTVQGKPVGNMILIRSFLPSDPPPVMTVDFWKDDYRWQWATTIGTSQGYGWINPFPQLGGLSVPYPLFTQKPCYFPTAGLIEYSGEPRSQYLPEREYYP